MVSRPEVLERLAGFVCVRLDWEQMQKHKRRLKVPTQGNQVLLDPRGCPIPGIDPRGKRYAIPEFLELLDRVAREFPPRPETGDDLELSWFLFNPRRHGLPEHAGCDFISRVDRKPVLTISGPIPAWMETRAFLRRHLREFVWTRGPKTGPATISIRQVEPERKVLADLELPPHAARSTTPPPGVGDALDAAWLEYMRVRPMVARGYIDNPHGNWLRPVLEGVHLEELDLREKALAGTLLPPGRPDKAPAVAPVPGAEGKP